MASTKSRQNRYFATLLLTPVVLAMLVLFIIPIFWNGWVSLHDVTFATFRKNWSFTGLENYLALIRDSVFPKIFHRALWITVIFTAASVIGQFVVGFGLALVLQRCAKGAQVFRAVIVLPWILSELVVAYIWMFMFQQHGPLNNFLGLFGVAPVHWLSSSSVAIWSLSLANIWFGAPFTILMMGAALTTINPETIEAARIDGAGPFQILVRITVPLLKSFIALNIVLITMWTVNIFALPLAMTQGGPAYATTTASLYMYRQAFEFGNFSIGSSTGILLFLFNVIGALVYIRAQRSSDHA